MAIYHLHTKPISRSSGRSAVAAAAYRTASRLLDERTGREHDYTRRGGVESIGRCMPHNLDISPADLWSRAELAEKRKDARVAREVEVAIPAELTTKQQRWDLVSEFAGRCAGRYGVGVQFAIHAPHRHGDQRNWHGHILMTTRKISETGELTEKAQMELSDSELRKRGLGAGRDEIERMREGWAILCNQALERAQSKERVDHRSLEAQREEALERHDFDAAAELHREPTIKMGWAAMKLERGTKDRPGIRTERGDINREIKAQAKERKRLWMQIKEIYMQSLEAMQQTWCETKRLAEEAISYFAETFGYTMGTNLQHQRLVAMGLVKARDGPGGRGFGIGE